MPLVRFWDGVKGTHLSSLSRGRDGHLEEEDRRLYCRSGALNEEVSTSLH